MKTKLSEIEQLRLEKAEIIKECRQYEEQLLERWKYSKDNFGQLTLNSILSSAKMGLNDLLGGFLGGKNTEKAKDSRLTPGFVQAIVTASPIIWNIAQPFLFKFALKKIKSLFNRK